MDKLIGCVQHDCDACKARGWIDASERLPETNDVVLAWLGDEAITVQYWTPGPKHHSEAGWADSFSNDEVYGVTHWMQIPPGPNVKGEQR